MRTKTATATAAAMTYLVAVVACTTLFMKSDPEVEPTGPRFDHAGHLERGIGCVDCHGEADVGWNAMPELDLCMGCHEDIDPEQEDETKHASAFFDADGKGLWRHASRLDDDVIFAHGEHVEANGNDCLACHKAVAESTSIRESARISMQDCMACHTARAPDKNDCATCHKATREDRRPETHHAGWPREHGRVAREGGYDPLPQNCSYCHNRSDCDDCHKGETPRDHNTMWRYHGHAAAASLDRDRCSVCHTPDTCYTCHRETEPRSHRGSWGSPRNRHCTSCHLPLGSGINSQNSCALCHEATTSHDMAPSRPPDSVHQTAGLAACRACHAPLEHPDNGQSCLICHK